MLGHKHDPFVRIRIDLKNAGVLEHEMACMERVASIGVVKYEVWDVIYVFQTNLAYRCKVMLLEKQRLSHVKQYFAL